MDPSLHAKVDALIDKIEAQEESAVIAWIILTSVTALGLIVSCIVMVLLLCINDAEPQPRPRRLKNEIEEAEMGQRSAGQAMDMEI